MVTGSIQYLRFTGAEMLIEIARFWASLATYNPKLDRYEILGVMGPDEYHDAYPGQRPAGPDNNTYTNVMAVWVLLRAMQALDELPPHYRHEVIDELGLGGDELDRWRDITSKMRVVFNSGGVLAQFEGYDQLQEFDWEGYRARYGNIRRLDRVLEAEGDSPNRYKISKQADVLMLLFLLSRDELRELLGNLGYRGDRGAAGADRRLLSRPHRRRLDAQRRGQRLGAGPAGPRIRHGVSSSARWTATSLTSRAGRPPRASTSGPWPERSTSCCAASPACGLAATRSGSIRRCRRRSSSSASASTTGGTGSRS